MADYTTDIDALFYDAGFTDEQFRLIAKLALTDPTGLAAACLDQAGVPSAAAILQDATTEPLAPEAVEVVPAPSWHRHCGCGRLRARIEDGTVPHKAGCSEVN